MLWVLFCCVPITAFASDCRERLIDCKEDCVLEFGGSVRLDMKHRYASCLVKCSDAESRCSAELSKPPKDAGVFIPDAGRVEPAKAEVIEVHLSRQPDAGVSPPQKAPVLQKPPKKEDDHDDLRFH